MLFFSGFLSLSLSSTELCVYHRIAAFNVVMFLFLQGTIIKVEKLHS